MHFDRPIDHDCLFCHSNRSEPVDLTANRYKEPVFLGHAIGCERCHGPGELHARRQELSGGRDLTIVNPRHLDPVLRGNVCEQCHLLGDRRVYRLGRDPTDYRPGLPLTEFFVDYGSMTGEGQKLVGQVQQMKASRCFRAAKAISAACRATILTRFQTLRKRSPTSARSVWPATGITDACSPSRYAWPETERTIALDATCRCRRQRMSCTSL